MTTGAGWWYTYPSEKYELVSWDDDYSQWEIKFMFKTSNQMTTGEFGGTPMTSETS
jgi:hypothetical protein